MGSAFRDRQAKASKPEADSEKLQTKSLRRLESYDRLKPFAEAPQVLALFSLGFAALTRCSLKRLAVAVRKSYDVTIPPSWSSLTMGRQPIPERCIMSMASSVRVVDDTL